MRTNRIVVQRQPQDPTDRRCDRPSARSRPSGGHDRPRRAAQATRLARHGASQLSRAAGARSRRPAALRRHRSLGTHDGEHRPLNDDRGQALPMTVFVFAIAVIAAVGIRATGERLLTRAHLERSASGASYAAAAKLADVYFEWQLARFDDEPRGRRPLSEVMSDRT